MPKKNTIIERDHGYDEVMRELRQLSRAHPRLTVGIHASDSKPYERGSGETATTAMIGTFHEFGTLGGYDKETKPSGARGVPKRSFLRSTVAENQGYYIDLVSEAIDDALLGKGSIRRGMGRLGAVIVGDVQEKISRGVGAPLTDETIERKGSSKQLVDTGQLRQSIDWEYDQ